MCVGGSYVVLFFPVELLRQKNVSVRIDLEWELDVSLLLRQFVNGVELVGFDLENDRT